MQRIFNHFDTPNEYRSSMILEKVLKFFSTTVKLVNILLDCIRNIKSNTLMKKSPTFMVYSY